MHPRIIGSNVESQIGGWLSMSKNELIRSKEKVYRILDMFEQSILVIDCLNLTMPQWIEAASISDAEVITDDELCSMTDYHLSDSA